MTSNIINDYAKNINQYDPVDKDAEEKLVNDFNAGDMKAREELIKSNLKLVIKIAHDFKNMGVALEDLVGAGNMGLMTAIDKYKSDKGAKFSSYAAFWIKSYMKNELCKYSRIVNFCPSTLIKMKKVKELKDNNLSAEEIAKELQTSHKTYIANLFNGYSQFSLNEKINDEEDKEKGDLFTDEEDSLNEKIEKNEILDYINQNYKKFFDEREQYILEHRFGINGNDIIVQTKVAKDLNLTHQRVQQLEKEVLEKLRKKVLK